LLLTSETNFIKLTTTTHVSVQNDAKPWLRNIQISVIASMSDKTTIQSIQGEYRGSITGQNEQKIIVSKLVLIQLPKKGHSEDSASSRQILTLMALAPTMHTVSLHSSITFHILANTHRCRCLHDAYGHVGQGDAMQD
jgi:hypothetical protein